MLLLAASPALGLHRIHWQHACDGPSDVGLASQVEADTHLELLLAAHDERVDQPAHRDVRGRC